MVTDDFSKGEKGYCNCDGKGLTYLIRGRENILIYFRFLVKGNKI